MSTRSGQITGKLETWTVTLDTNLENKERFFVNMDGTDGNVVNIAANGSANSFVLIEGGDGSVSPVVGAIALDGVTQLELGGTVTQGQFLMPDSNGKGVTATDGNYYGALALENGVSGDYISVKIARGYLETT